MRPVFARLLLPALVLPVLALPVLAQAPAQMAPQAAPRPALQAQFLPRAEAAKVLVGDDYFHLLHTPELRAKTGLPLAGMTDDQARDAARAFYADSAKDFTPEERAGLQAILDHAAPEIAAKLPLMARTPFRFIKAGVEGGLPHTRGACIVLAPRVVAALARIAAEQPAALDRAASLLVHEQTHVLEREHPEVFASLFTEIFGFRRLASVPDAPSLAERRVVNPDGPDLGWAFPIHDGPKVRWIRPDLQLAQLEHPRMPQDFQEVAVDLVETDGAFALDLDAGGQPKVENLQALKAYEDAFAGVGEDFHPHEIAAVLLSGWVTGTGSPAQAPLQARTAAWAGQHLR